MNDMAACAIAVGGHVVGHLSDIAQACQAVRS